MRIVLQSRKTLFAKHHQFVFYLCLSPEMQNCTVSDRYHAARRALILEKHPEIRSLKTVDPSFKYVAVACALTQLSVAFLLRQSPLSFVLTFALCCGTLFDCAITNSLHEVVHDLAFQGRPSLNKIFGALINLAVAFPVVGGYYTSHRYHHSFLGTNLDVKYPSLEEAARYDDHVWSRLQFVFAHPILAGSRWQKNVGEKPSNFAYWNLITILISDVAILSIMGWKSLLYLMLSFWINDTIFVQGSKNFADHWVDDQVTHTNSYYGFFNLFNFNIGFHREHHDFPYIPGRYLPLARKIAVEFYSDPDYIEKSIFTNIYCMLFAERGCGLKKFANKLTYNARQLETYGENSNVYELPKNVDTEPQSVNLQLHSQNYSITRKTLLQHDPKVFARFLGFKSEL